jgi:hypothetical protein
MGGLSQPTAEQKPANPPPAGEKYALITSGTP